MRWEDSGVLSTGSTGGKRAIVCTCTSELRPHPSSPPLSTLLLSSSPHLHPDGEHLDPTLGLTSFSGQSIDDDQSSGCSSDVGRQRRVPFRRNQENPGAKGTILFLFGSMRKLILSVQRHQ